MFTRTTDAKIREDILVVYRSDTSSMTSSSKMMLVGPDTIGWKAFKDDMENVLVTRP